MSNCENNDIRSFSGYALHKPMSLCVFVTDNGLGVRAATQLARVLPDNCRLRVITCKWCSEVVWCDDTMIQDVGMCPQFLSSACKKREAQLKGGTRPWRDGRRN